MIEHPWHVRLWQSYVAWSITVEGEIVWWSTDDVSFRKRKVAFEVNLPRRVWDIYCLLRGGHEEHYGECVFCQTPMDERELN